MYIYSIWNDNPSYLNISKLHPHLQFVLVRSPVSYFPEGVHRIIVIPVVGNHRGLQIIRRLALLGAYPTSRGPNSGPQKGGWRPLPSLNRHMVPCLGVPELPKRRPSRSVPTQQMIPETSRKRGIGGVVDSCAFR